MNHPLLILADAHLRSADEIMVDFLDQMRQENPHLIILGDFFEYLAGPNRYSLSIYSEVLRALAQWPRIDYLEGNHDFDLVPASMAVPGLRIHPQRLRMDLVGLRVGLMHGDRCNPQDWGTSTLRAILQSTGLRWLRDRILPDEAVHRFAMSFAQLSRRSTWPGRQNEQSVVLDGARAWQRNEALDLVMFGHTHQPHLEAGPWGVLLNPGPAAPGGSYAWVQAGQVQLRRFPSGETIQSASLEKNITRSLRNTGHKQRHRPKQQC